MVFTAVLAAIAVIAAMVHVPLGTAQAEEIETPKAMNDLGPKFNRGGSGIDDSWGNLVWAGKPVSEAEAEKDRKETGRGNKSEAGNPANDVGWALCIDPGKQMPMSSGSKYQLANSEKLQFDTEHVNPAYRDAAINLASKLRDAYANEDKQTARDYWVYLVVLIGSGQADVKAADFLTGNLPQGGGFAEGNLFEGFAGSEKKFTQLTGFRIVNTNPVRLEPVEGIEVPKAPEDAYITVIGPNGNLKPSMDQRIMPADQPGLPKDEEPGTETLEPSIETKAEFAEGSTRVVNGAVVTDTVTYEGLVDGKNYHLDAKLMSKDGKTVLGTGSADFEADSSKGFTTVDIKVDNAEKPVDSAVAFEELTSTEVESNGDETPDAEKPNKIAEHKDLEDQAQTVDSKETLEPSIETKAEFAEGSTRVVNGAVVTDTVTYEGLVDGKNYHLDAKLMSKDGKTVLGTGSADFEADSSKGFTTVDIKVDNAEKPVDSAVAFEELTSTEVESNGDETPDAEKPNKIAEHKDLEDQAQTVDSKDENKPSESTTPETTTSTEHVPGQPGDGGESETSKPSEPSSSEETSSSEQSSTEDSSTPKTSETCESEEPSDSESEKPSESEEPSESESSEPSESVETTTSQASETSETSTSEEPSDCESTTPDKPSEPSEEKTPKISTNADFEEGSHEVVAGAKIVDEVSYEGLVPGKEYTLKAELISKKDGKSVLGEGEATFTPEKSNGMEPVTITVNDDVTEPVEAAVAFEYLTSTEVNEDGKDEPTDEDSPNDITKHDDINDKDQTVTSEDGPKVSTNADFEGGLREVVAGAKVVDQVSYEGLVPGKEYTLDAQLISKEDGKTVLGETKGHKFTPESANGTEAVTIVVDEKVTEPVEAAVAFETLTSTQVDKHGEENPTDEDNPNPVGEHKDINDDDQTVTSEDFEKTPKITTNANFEEGSKYVVAGAKIVDDVTYEGLVPGKEYTLKAELINKKDGKSVLGEGEATFTPEESKGVVPVTITVNDDVKEPVQAAVAFEELTSTEVNKGGEETPDTNPEKPNHIAEHKDIDDDAQTVTSHEVDDQDTPDGSSDGSSNGSSKDNKWWLILIPGIGLGKIIKDHFDHKDHGNHNGGHGDNTSSHNGGHGDNTGNHNGGNGHEVKGQDAPKSGNSDNGNGRGVEVQGQQPEETGNALPSNADRVEIKSVPSGASELEPGMQDYIK